MTEQHWLVTVMVTGGTVRVSGADIRVGNGDDHGESTFDGDSGVLLPSLRPADSWTRCWTWAAGALVAR